VGHLKNSQPELLVAGIPNVNPRGSNGTGLFIFTKIPRKIGILGGSICTALPCFLDLPLRSSLNPFRLFIIIFATPASYEHDRRARLERLRYADAERS
jgi:hypothetical protein